MWLVIQRGRVLVASFNPFVYKPLEHCITIFKQCFSVLGKLGPAFYVP